MKVYGYGTHGPNEKLDFVTFERKDPRPGELALRITHCGICHSDLHQARDDWENTNYPCVPGHEIVGVVTRVGDGVTRFREGDRVGVGCMINSCQQCAPCQRGDEQYCSGPKSCTLTYNGTKVPDGSNTYGGYSTEMVVREEFALRIPKQLDSEKVGPIMCAGITVYAPMVHWNLEKGQTLGVVGIGGLGHMAVRIGKVLGARVVAFTRSENKREAILKMGADEVIISSDEEAMEEAAQTLDLMINTIPVPHQLDPYIELIKPDSTLVIVGNMMKFPEFVPGPLVFHRISLAGSLIGGVQQTQEVLDLCAEHQIAPAIEVISIDQVNQVFDKLAQGNDSDFRHVINMDTLRSHQNLEAGEAKTIESPERGEVVGRAREAVTAG